MNSVCELFEGTQESDWESRSILQMEDRFKSGGIGESEKVYMRLYPNRWDLVNHNREYRQVVILRLSGLRPKL